MAAVKCNKCGAAITVTLAEGRVTVSHGAAFRSKCKELGRGPSADFVVTATECTSMRAAVARAVRRLSNGQAMAPGV
jgi:hypothetical protein